MANPIKYSTTQVANTIKKGNSVLGVGNNGFGASSETGFWAGVDPPNGGYTVYVNTSGTSGPRIYIADDNSLSSLVNQIGASGITTLSGALEWIDSQSNIICVNREYEGIVTSGLIYNVDAGFVPSYCRSGTNWRDLSGNNKDTTLTNGPVFNSGEGGSITFDGVDDYGAISGNSFGYSPGTTGSLSLEIWIYPTGPYTSYTSEPPTTNLGGIFGQGYFANSTGWGIGMYKAGGINYWAFQTRRGNTGVQPPGVSFTDGSWYHVIGSFTRGDLSRLYVNGSLQSSVSSSALNSESLNPTSNNAQLGRITQASTFYAGCRISCARMYNRALSATEVLQNFNATKSRFGL